MHFDLGGSGGSEGANAPTPSKRSRRGGKRLKAPSSASAAANAVKNTAFVDSAPLEGCSTWDTDSNDGNDRGGYNSEDEYSHLGQSLTEEEWEAKERRFEKQMKKKGYIIKRMADDGSCLFRAVADQVFGEFIRRLFDA